MEFGEGSGGSKSGLENQANEKSQACRVVVMAWCGKGRYHVRHCAPVTRHSHADESGRTLDWPWHCPHLRPFVSD